MTLPTTIAGNIIPKPHNAGIGFSEYQALTQGIKEGLKARKEGRRLPLNQVMAEFGLR
jgi:hypothetical protein